MKKTTFFFIPSLVDIKTGYTELYAGTVEELMEHNPPCKECLVQPACVTYNRRIKIKTCDEMKKFINDNGEYFK